MIGDITMQKLAINEKKKEKLLDRLWSSNDAELCVMC